MTQSSIEFLIESIDCRSMWTTELRAEAKQALEMYKKEMIDFASKYDEYCHNSFIQNSHTQIKSAEEFYQETFENK